jgi:hypothetical protein
MRSGAQTDAHPLYIGLAAATVNAARHRAVLPRSHRCPERLVDRIEVMDAFSLATLPADAAMAALDLSKQRRNCRICMWT